MKKVAVVTGGSGGIGKAVAQRLLESGYTVYEISRSGQSENGIAHRTADVTDEATVEAVFSDIHKEQGRIDLVVNNAGFGISGATEFTSIKDAERLFSVNFFGTAASIKASVRYLRETRGRIINISSVAGAIPIPFQSYYSASKAAVNALCEAVRCEVRPFGVTACCVLPGDVKTGFTEVREKDHVGDDVYQGRIERSVSMMEKDEQNGMSPAYVANRVLKIAQKKRVRLYYTVGFAYVLLSFAARVFPRRLVNRLVGMIYAK